jgi:uncharacterized protein (TIGR00251 family)
MKIRVKVTPNSKKEEVTMEGDTFWVRVKEPAREGKANVAIIKALAGYFGVAKSQVSILSGFTSRNKTIEISK